jgi:hypothetical protein
MFGMRWSVSTTAIGAFSEHGPDGARVTARGLGEELDAAHVRHALVGEHDRDRRLLVEDLERAARVGRGEDLVLAFEGEGHRLEDRLLVVDDQDPGQTLGHHHPR